MNVGRMIVSMTCLNQSEITHALKIDYIIHEDHTPTQTTPKAPPTIWTTSSPIEGLLHSCRLTDTPLSDSVPGSCA